MAPPGGIPLGSAHIPTGTLSLAEDGIPQTDVAVAAWSHLNAASTRRASVYDRDARPLIPRNIDNDSYPFFPLYPPKKVNVCALVIKILK